LSTGLLNVKHQQQAKNTVNSPHRHQRADFSWQRITGKSSEILIRVQLALHVLSRIDESTPTKTHKQTDVTV